MERPESARMSGIILSAPVWCRLALACPDERLRERGADVLAAILVSRLNEPEPPVRDERQMILPIAL
jgi:hypothetical protein